jgi:hypothetical protein
MSVRSNSSRGGTTLGGNSTSHKSDNGGPSDRNNLRRNIREKDFLDGM